MGAALGPTDGPVGILVAVASTSGESESPDGSDIGVERLERTNRALDASWESSSNTVK